MTDPLDDLRTHEAQNRRSWDDDSDEYQARHGAPLAERVDLAAPPDLMAPGR